METFDEYTDSLFDVPEYRFTEFREVDGRTIYGIAVDYNDVSLRPGGMQERFEIGAFGDVSSLDTILHFQHSRDRPIARTGGGGLVLTDSAERLEVAATLALKRKTPMMLYYWHGKGYLTRLFSTEFNARRERYESKHSNH